MPFRAVKDCSIARPILNPQRASAFHGTPNHVVKRWIRDKRVKRQARSITIDFPEYDGLHVDAVPARKRSDGYWEIPTSDGGWQTTNPEKQTELKAAMNDAFTGDYVPFVKLVRQTRRTILTSRPGGLFAELALYDACVNLKVSKVNRTLGYVTALEAVADYLDDKVNWGANFPTTPCLATT